MTLTDSEDEASDASDDEQPGGPSRVSCRTRTGRTATYIHTYILYYSSQRGSSAINTQIIIN